MTRQEAIHELYDIFGYGFYNEKVDEALNMAIKALEQLSLPKIIVSQGERSQNCVKCKHYCETEDDTGVHSQCRLESDTMEKIRWYCDRCGEEFIFHRKLTPIEISYGERMADNHVYARREFCDKCFNEVKEQLLSVLLRKGATCSENAQVDKLRKAAEETEDNGVRKGILKAIEVLEGDTE